MKTNNQLKKTVLFLLIIFRIFNVVSQNENVLYIVDSIPIIEEPKNGFGILTENDIDNVVVIKNKKTIDSIGYKNLDGIIYVFTKDYIQRPDSIKAIPTTNKMTKINGVWCLKNATPYSGKFIDYYLNGKIQGEGVLFNGKLKGKRLKYHLSGKVSDEIEYDNGISNGLEQRFYADGTLMQKGVLKNGKEVGDWEMYHPNGQLKQKAHFTDEGKMDGEVVSYYSTGKIRGTSYYENGVFIKDKLSEKLFDYYNESQELYKQVNYKAAIKKLTKAIELDSTWADGYFARGTMKLNDFQFDEALSDFNKALEIEPYFTNAYSNRAFTIIIKHEFSDSRTISKSNDFQILATKEVEIPKSEMTKICQDLNKAVSLGDDNHMILDALEKYCKE